MKDKIPTLTRKDIAREVSKQLSLRIPEADKMVDTVLTSIRELLMTADPEVRLEVRDFGVFEVKLTKAKPRARNPKTGAKVHVPPRRKTHFKPSKLMRSFLMQPLTPQAEAKLIERERAIPNIKQLQDHSEDVITQ